METTRQNRISRLIQKELSLIFQSQTRQLPGVLVSVSAVRISPDLSVARAYLSIFPSERSEEICRQEDQIHFGKHAGKTLKQIKEIDPSYILWMQTQELKWPVNKLLNNL